MRKAISIIAAMAGALAASPAHAGWEFKLIEDPMTDAKRGISLLIGDKGGIAIKCDSNGPGSLYISVISDKYLGGVSNNKSRLMRYRVDKGQPQEIRAYHSDSSASLFELAPQKEGGRFLASILDARELIVQVSSYDYDTYTIVFDVTGARQAVAKSAATCGDTEWSNL